jgi:tubulin polyglutamylase TTLL1/tubulin monoglycylase TTLL3/8
MLITINNGKLRGYWYHDGYIRTSSYQWSLDTITDNFVHLTNDAIQKHSSNYGKYEAGNKLNYS